MVFGIKPDNKWKTKKEMPTSLDDHSDPKFTSTHVKSRTDLHTPLRDVKIFTILLYNLFQFLVFPSIEILLFTNKIKLYFKRKIKVL